jgi:hypothetical protein
MAEFTFLATWTDSLSVLRSIFAQMEIRFVPDRWYPSDIPDAFTALDDTLLGILRECRKGFILSDRISKFPIGLVEQRNGPRAGQYYARPTLGGPCLELTLPAAFEDRGILCLNTGSLVRHREFFNPATSLWEKPSMDLKAEYQKMAKIIRTCLTKPDHRSSVWIGREARRMLEAGKARITAKGLSDRGTEPSRRWISARRTGL